MTAVKVGSNQKSEIHFWKVIWDPDIAHSFTQNAIYLFLLTLMADSSIMMKKLYSKNNCNERKNV